MTPRPSQPALISVVIVLVALAILVVATGCVPKILPDPPKSILPSTVPASLAAVSKGMSGLVWVGVVAFALGVGGMFFMKNGRIPNALMAIGGALFVVALGVQVSLPFLPWVFLGLSALGLVWLVVKYLLPLWKGATTTSGGQ